MLKLHFLGWCRYYKSIYDDEEKPSQSVIDDDEELDNWIKLKEIEYRKLKHEQQATLEKSHPRKGKSKTSLVSLDHDFNDED